MRPEISIGYHDGTGIAGVLYECNGIFSISCGKCFGTPIFWIPAFAGMTTPGRGILLPVIPAKAGIQEVMPRLIEMLHVTTESVTR